MRRVLTLRGQTHGSFLVNASAREVVLATVRDAQSWGAASRASRVLDVRRIWAAIAAAARPLAWWRAPTVAVAARRAGDCADRFF